ncbi:MAG: hypothetical protein PHI31_14345 [Desulfuromonadaceae bacterium]|nr:hypothetical protein [Desulfuromonadaceae bacterium]
MRVLFRCCAVASLVVFLALPVIVTAEEPENYEKDAQSAENTPPMIPHAVKDTADGSYCLGCHRTGAKGAPETPHPERLSCTGCHARGETKQPKLHKKGGTKK